MDAEQVNQAGAQDALDAGQQNTSDDARRDLPVAEGTVQAQRKDGGMLFARFCDVFVMRDGRISSLVSYLMEVKGPTA